jgi:hypothetical protein
MLQAIHKKKRVGKASSLYCQWICVERAGGRELVAVWIDSEMRAFTGGQSSATQLELQPDEICEEAGLAVRDPQQVCTGIQFRVAM